MRYSYFKILIITLIVFFLTFFLEFILVHGANSNINYVNNVSVDPSKTSFLSNTSGYNYVYYIPMTEINSNDYNIILDNNFPSDHSFQIYAIGNCNSIPSSGVSFSNVSYSTTLINNSIDITDNIRNKYNSSYSFVFVYIKLLWKSDIEFLSFISSFPEPTPEPTPDPTPDPTPEASPSAPPYIDPEDDNGTLDNYTFWSTVYDKTWKSGTTMSSYVQQRFVASSASNFTDSDTGIHNYILTIPIRIPFRIECTNFKGSGLIDVSYKFDFNYDLFGFDDTKVNYMVDFSSPWIQSADNGISFNASNKAPYGYSFDVFNLGVNAELTSQFYYCVDMYVSMYSNVNFTNYGNFVDITLSNISFDVNNSTKVSNGLSSDILESIYQGVKDGNEQEKQYHEEEIVETERAIDNMNESVYQLNETLSSWEIVTLPIKVTGDLIDALTADGSTEFTFPSFELMDQQLWPSYTFDLNTIKEKFPILITALHTMSSILLVRWFIKFLRLKLTIIGLLKDPDVTGWYDD